MMPRRRWVGSTATSSTPPVAASPPGMFMRHPNAWAVPTILPPSNTASERSWSGLAGSAVASSQCHAKPRAAAVMNSAYSSGAITRISRFKGCSVGNALRLS